MTLLHRYAFGGKSAEIASAMYIIEVQDYHHYFATLTSVLPHSLLAKGAGQESKGPRCRPTGMGRAHNLGLSDMAPLALAGTCLPRACPRWPAPDCVWLQLLLKGHE